MIINQEPLSFAEVRAMAKEKEELEKFIKTFSKIKLEDAKSLIQDIEKLGILKIKKEHIVKIVDLLPEDASDLNKIFVDVSLNEEETKRILDVTKKYK